MAVLPPEYPVTIPVDEPTSAMDGLLLLHVPPDVASLSVVVRPWHISLMPVIAAGKGYTVSMVVIIHPVGKVYVTVEVPAERPVAMPVPEPIVATDVLLLAHVPPPGSNKVVVAPIQIPVTPVITEGSGLTVIVLYAEHPVEANPYVMVAVPAVMPVTSPVDDPTVATEVLLLLHTPPLVASLSAVVNPTQTAAVPVIGTGVGLTVTVVPTAQLTPVPVI